MSVTDFKELNTNRSGREVYQDDGTTVTTMTRAWRVYVDSQSDTPKTILDYASLPKIGTAYPGFATCRCISRQAAPESASQKKQFKFQASYSTKWDIAEDPLDDPAQTEWSSQAFQRSIFGDIDGNAILNSAGDPYDPPAEKDDSRWTSVTRKNVSDAVPSWIFAYQDATNSDEYTIDGKTIDIGEAKISAIHLGTRQERNEIGYRVLTVTIHYRGEGDDADSSGYGSGSGDDEVEPWYLCILDHGFRELDSDGELQNIKNDDGDGEPVTAPVMLDGSGSKLDDPIGTNAVFNYYEVYRKRAFSLIESIFS